MMGNYHIYYSINRNGNYYKKKLQCSVSIDKHNGCHNPAHYSLMSVLQHILVHFHYKYQRPAKRHVLKCYVHLPNYTALYIFMADHS